MPTEFDDSLHYGIFTTSPTLTSNTGKMVRQSELTLAALRAAGVFDNMVDGTVPPTTDKLWLDKNLDPAVLKEWDATGSAWEPMTFDRLFGRAVVTPFAAPSGTADALIVAQPSPFMNNRLYSLTPAADNTGAATIHVTGVGTYPVRYIDGTDLEAKELSAGNAALLLFTGTAFAVLNKVAPIHIAVAAAEEAADRAEDAQEAAEAAAASIQTFAFRSRADAMAATPTIAPDFIDVKGYASNGDGGAAKYRKVLAEPTHAGKFSLTLADGVTIVWYELAERMFVEPRMFGASPAATPAVNSSAFLACRDFVRAIAMAGFFVAADPAGAYQLEAETNLGDSQTADFYKGLNIQGIGRPHLKMIGAGEGLQIINSSLSNEYRWHVENFIIEGSAVCTAPFSIGNMNHSTFKQIETRECTYAGIKSFNTVCNYWETCTGGNGQYGPQANTPAFLWLRTNDFASTYVNCRGEGSVHNPFSVNYAPSDVNVANDTITVTAHRFLTGVPIYFTTTASGPAGTNSTQMFYVIVVNANTIKVATSYDAAVAGTAVNITSQGSGTHTIHVMHTGVAYHNSDWSSDVGGTYEGVSCGANILDAASSHIGFSATDFEANTHHDVVYLGRDHYFEKIQSISPTQFENILIVNGATNSTHVGGFSRRIHNPGNSYAKIIGVSLSDNVALGITGTGKRWVFGCVLRAVDGSITAEVPDRFGAFYAVSTGSGTTTNAVRIDSGIGPVFIVRDDGVTRIPGAYTATTAAAANLFANTDGTLLRSTSALKYKIVGDPLSEDTVNKIMSLRGFHYRDISDPDGRSYVGMAADHFDEIGLWDFVHYREDGEVEGLMYDRMMPAVILKFAMLEAAQAAEYLKIEKRVAKAERTMKTALGMIAKLDKRVGAIEARS